MKRVLLIIWLAAIAGVSSYYTLQYFKEPSIPVFQTMIYETVTLEKTNRFQFDKERFQNAESEND